MKDLVERMRRVMWLNEQTAEILDRLERRILQRGGEAMTRLLKRVMFVTMLLLGLATDAGAELQGLYLNFDNKRWTLVTTHINEEECDKAARRAMRERQAYGAGCATFTPPRETKQWKPGRDDGFKTKEQQRIDERNQVYENRRDRFEGQFYRATPGR